MWRPQRLGVHEAVIAALAIQAWVHGFGVHGNGTGRVFVKRDQDSSQCHLKGEHRSDCYPETGVTEAACLSRGCCWQTTNVKGAPYCFYPPGEDYSVQKVINNGMSVLLTRSQHTHWPNDVMDLQADVMEETSSRLRFKIYDPNNKRYEVPLPLNKASGSSQQTAYSFTIDHNPFGLTVTRKSTKSVL